MKIILIDNRGNKYDIESIINFNLHPTFCWENNNKIYLSFVTDKLPEGIEVLKSKQYFISCKIEGSKVDKINRFYDIIKDDKSFDKNTGDYYVQNIHIRYGKDRGELYEFAFHLENN